jgi:MFS transporter, DHA3 family, multidrug efflux protein
MKTFYKLLINTSAAAVVINFLWFAITFWVYLETKSVLATSIIGGSYMLFSAFSGLYFGTYVDHHKKKQAMVVSSTISLISFALATSVYFLSSKASLLNLASPNFWLFTLLVLGGAVVGNMRYIAISTTVTMLVPEGQRDKANGLVGTAQGISFTLTSVFSGLAVGFLGMGWALGISVALTLLATLHLLPIKVEEKGIVHVEGQSKKIDIVGTLKAVHLVPGLLGLLLFATFNNFLGGVFMSLMDAYGLNMVSVQVWGFMWAGVSLGFIFGGVLVAKKGLGKNPLNTLLIASIAMWVICILFPIKSAILPLALGMLAYMCLIPIVEAAEQTVIQKVVPFEMQGRVFGLGQTLESAASPITAFMIGPIAQFWILPYMTTGGGVNTIGRWFGTGQARGMALIFISTGIIGLIVTVLALFSRSYHVLSKAYMEK